MTPALERSRPHPISIGFLAVWFLRRSTLRLAICPRVVCLALLSLSFLNTPVVYGQAVPSRQETPLSTPLPPPEVPAAQKITLAQAVTIALADNPLLRAAEHQVAGARANLSGQRAPLNPALNFAGLNNTVGSINFGNLNNYAVTMTLETSGRQRVRTNQAHAQLQGVQADAETTRLMVRQAVTAAYIDLQVANGTLTNELQAYETARRLNELTETQFKLGAVPETNSLRTRIALVQEAQNLIKAGNAVELARANLNLQMGRQPEEPVDASEPLEIPPWNVSLAMLQRQALLNRPEIRSAEANQRALQETVKMQRSQYYPDVVVGTSGQFDSLQMGFALPLFDLGSIQGSVRKAREDVKAQEAQVSQVRQQVQLDVQSAYLNLLQAQGLAATFQSGILPRAEALLQRIEAGYKLGGSTILDLIDAQQTYRTTRNDYLAALGDYRRAINQLERAVGVSMVSMPK